MAKKVGGKMPIQSIHSFPAHNVSSNRSQHVTPAEAGKQFGQILKNAIERVNHSQVEADQLVQRLANGEAVQLHDVMIASQKASITLNLALEVRNKVVEAYQEMMRMQI